jgi:ferredoxin
VRIRVDPDKCIGSGVCEVLASHAFLVSDDGLCQVLVADDDSDADSRVLKAIESCPPRAITLA